MSFQKCIFRKSVIKDIETTKSHTSDYYWEVFQHSYFDTKKRNIDIKVKTSISQAFNIYKYVFS